MGRDGKGFSTVDVRNPQDRSEYRLSRNGVTSTSEEITPKTEENRHGKSSSQFRGVRQRTFRRTAAAQVKVKSSNPHIPRREISSHCIRTVDKNNANVSRTAEIPDDSSCKLNRRESGVTERNAAQISASDESNHSSNHSAIIDQGEAEGTTQSFPTRNSDAMLLRSARAVVDTNSNGENMLRAREEDFQCESSSRSSSSLTSGQRSDPDFETSRKRKYMYVNRRRKEPSQDSSVLKRRKLKMESLDDRSLGSMICCIRLRCFKIADKSYLRAQSRRVLLLNQFERRQVLQSMLDTQMQAFKFNGSRVCAVFLERAFGFSRYLQAVVKGTPASKRPREQTGNDVTRIENSQKDAVICYLERLAESTADKMPDRDELHLPFFVKDDVYKDFEREFRMLHPPGSDRRGSNLEVPSRSYFYSMWSKHCSKIKVRRTHRFTKCGDCERFRAALEEKRTDANATKAVREKKNEHNEMVARERREYAKKVQKATLYPYDYCSIIVDGADQSAFGLPHFTVSVKEARGHAIKVKLVGVLEHGAFSKVSLFLMTDQYETGANHVIEAIHRHLTHRKLGNPLPRTLYLQLDNCQRENKNQFLFGYLESLVAWGVFCEVFASFLPIGHTHADVDQVFSRTSTRLRHHDAVSMDDLMNQLSKSYTPKPRVVHMKGLVNFSTLIRKSKCVSAPTGFTSYRYFHFTRAKNNPSSSDEEHYRTTCLVRMGL